MKMVFAQIQNVTMKAESRLNVAKKSTPKASKPKASKPKSNMGLTIAKGNSNNKNGLTIRRG